MAALSKVAAQKTAGLAGDDLAVNAENLVGLQPSRELPIVGKVALGSTVNKVILVPLALVLPASVLTPLLMFGGTFLCYEGVHKILHKKDEAHHEELVDAMKRSGQDLAQLEASRVKQAIVTDFILSAEIVAVALSTVIDEPLATRALVVSLIALGMTAGIYGLVAVIVKVDDVGLHLQSRHDQGRALHRLGGGLVAAMPWFMKGLSWLGTFAMFLVGGGILLHGFHAAEEVVHHAVEAITHAPLGVSLLTAAATLVLGMLVGGVATALVEGVKRLTGRAEAH